jgi:hypothetical protein
MGLLDILQGALGGATPEQHFDHVTGQATQGELGAGLADAMRSDETPAFGDMVGKIFGQSNSVQQAGVLNQILATLGPAALALGGGVLGRMLAPGQTQITPAQASQLSPEQANEIAAHAEQAHPGVVDKVAGFYAEHAGLIKFLGGAALAVTMAKMKQNATRG